MSDQLNVRTSQRRVAILAIIVGIPLLSAPTAASAFCYEYLPGIKTKMSFIEANDPGGMIWMMCAPYEKPGLHPQRVMFGSNLAEAPREFSNALSLQEPCTDSNGEMVTLLNERRQVVGLACRFNSPNSARDFESFQNARRQRSTTPPTKRN